MSLALGLMVPFHLLSLFTMNRFFWENLVVIGVLFLVVPYVGGSFGFVPPVPNVLRRGVRRTDVSRIEESQGSEAVRTEARSFIPQKARDSG